jgi:uncharacterized membrane protein YidH (DUF202 family)
MATTSCSETQSPKVQRRNTLRVFYFFVFVAIATFTLAVRARQSTQAALIAVGIFLAGGAIWTFVRFLRAGDTHQQLINYNATSFAFAASLLLTLVVGLL